MADVVAVVAPSITALADILGLSRTDGDHLVIRVDGEKFVIDLERRRIPISRRSTLRRELLKKGLDYQRSRSLVGEGRKETFYQRYCSGRGT